jgi:hypothetical protein
MSVDPLASRGQRIAEARHVFGAIPYDHARASVTQPLYRVPIQRRPERFRSRIFLRSDRGQLIVAKRTSLYGRRPDIWGSGN